MIGPGAPPALAVVTDSSSRSSFKTPSETVRSCFTISTVASLGAVGSGS